MNPIVLKLATSREDKGVTDNYRVFGGSPTMAAKDRKGELIQRNAIVGGNGTIYVAKALAEHDDEIVVLGKKEYDRLTGKSNATKKKGR